MKPFLFLLIVFSLLNAFISRDQIYSTENESDILGLGTSRIHPAAILLQEKGHLINISLLSLEPIARSIGVIYQFKNKLSLQSQFLLQDHYFNNIENSIENNILQNYWLSLQQTIAWQLSTLASMGVTLQYQREHNSLFVNQKFMANIGGSIKIKKNYLFLSIRQDFPIRQGLGLPYPNVILANLIRLTPIKESKIAFYLTQQYHSALPEWGRFDTGIKIKLSSANEETQVILFSGLSVHQLELSKLILQGQCSLVIKNLQLFYQLSGYLNGIPKHHIDIGIRW